jgi:glycerol-3-phosphate dehydrogenase
VLVVGGGITGAGIALEASLRGYRCGLVERGDFASGTSSRSTKLIHGGLRYLLHGAAEFVRESLEERAFLLRHAPTLVTPLPFLAPIAWMPQAADEIERLLAAYDGLAGPESGLAHHRRVPSTELASRSPLLAGLEGDAFEYHEAVTDDARLTLAVLEAATRAGAIAVNHLALSRIDRTGPEVQVDLRDGSAGGELPVSASVLVLAVGPALSTLAAKLGLRPPALQPAKGVHVVLRQSSPPTASALLLVHPRDGRQLSLVPWRGHLVLGSTDTPCRTDEIDDPRPERTDVEYLLEALGAVLPRWRPEITAAWAGVRPLVGDASARTADLSREDRIVDLAPGVVAVAGGKLTTFRPVARRVVDHLDEGTARPAGSAPYPDLVDPLPASDTTAVDRHAASAPRPRLRPDQLRKAAAIAVASTLDDVVTQRLGLSLVEPAEAAKRAGDWAAEVGGALNWSVSERDRQVHEFRDGLARFRWRP